MTSPQRAAVYLRISRDRTGQEAGVDRQRYDCAALVEARGWDLVDTYVDNDLSAYSGKPRPGFTAMLDAVRAGRVDVIVAWHPDRITRHPRELEDVIDTLEAARCKVETVRAGLVDFTTRSGRTSARMVGVMARDESEAKSERLVSMHEAKARAGEWKGGTRPYGYRPEASALVIDSDEAEVIAEVSGRVLGGESLHGICADLNGRGVATVKGAAWRPQTLRRIVTGHTIVGRRAYRGEDVGPAAWPAIVDEKTWRRVRAVLDRPDRARGRVARVSLLAGLVYCGHEGCGVALRTQRRSSGVRVYVCPATTMGGCGGISVIADPLDLLVATSVVTFLESETPIVVSLDGDADSATAELAELEQELVDLAADIGAGRIGRAEWLAWRAPLEARRDAARSRLDSMTATTAAGAFVGRGAALAAEWPSMTLDQQRAIVGSLLDRVEVMPAARRGRGFDGTRVRSTWRV